METNITKKLTKEQLDYLFNFVAKNVKFYDLQCELVDHIAAGIETRMSTEPGISFNEAFKLEFSKFGVSGFKEIEEERLKYLIKRYRKIIWKIFKSFFALPQILLTLSLLLVVRFGVAYVPVNYLKPALLGYALLVLCLAITAGVKAAYRLKREKHIFVFEDIIFNKGMLGIALFVFNASFWNFMERMLGKANLQLYNGWLVAGLIVLASMFVYIGYYKIPKDANKYLQELYPEYKIAKATV